MLYLGADHRGFKLKEFLKKHLEEKGIPYQDLGNTIFDPDDDDVDFAEKVAKKVAGESSSKGILICGSGVSVCVAANKINGIRCGQVFSPEMAKHAREHDDINILALAGDVLEEKVAGQIMEKFLNTDFSNKERYLRRINKIKKLEEK
ncbi:RpiB/LacA/LacB family sugar-phosphate isomerase [Candidatus Gottesmanbacteria bacterium]|nr:RpiB/LacA/LacB family sugar-phosphate isomerase [Candidatus Gottesmanbacteria bacterium]